MADTRTPARAGTRAPSAAARSAYWSEEIPRLPKTERYGHWLMAGSGIIAMVTGMGWYWKPLGVILTAFGGGVVARWIHVGTGVVFSLTALWLIGAKWGKEILVPKPHDLEWMKTGGGYLTPQKEGVHHDHAPAGFFNAGQKMLGWAYVGLAVLFLVTGVVVWWPELFGPALVRIMLPLHALGFIGFAAGLVMHVYLSTAANPGTFRALTKGVVTRLWAHDHHPLWYKQVEAAEQAHAGRRPAAEVKA